MKKISMLLACLLIITTTVGCTGGNTGSTSQAPASSNTAPSGESVQANSDTVPYIAVITKSFVGDFWKTVELGAKEAGEQLGIKVTIEGPDAETNIEQQIKMIENAVQKGADAIVISALDTKAMVPAVEDAISKGVVVVTFNSKLESDKIACHIATDNWAAGVLAGEKLSEVLEGQGKVAIIGSVEGVKNNRDRSDGAAEIIAANSGMNLIGIQYCDNDMNKAISIAKDFMTANPDIAGFFSNNETSSIGVATALKENGMEGKIKHIAFDSSAQIIAQVKGGISDGFVTQDPYRMGYLAVESALKVINGEEVPSFVDTGCVYVDMNNMEEQDIEKILYPFGK